ncbi:unnamed protein product [Protopolystoma xenopodis]|uniref:PDZ domain-containing protein n=1 Tax=Protopolystoma xenopodis TaxID=117903 RepID=A0A3S5CD03_9PLAT|nr:unnamed protein product [Protopolystoma xenopodis]
MSSAGNAVSSRDLVMPASCLQDDGRCSHHQNAPTLHDHKREVDSDSILKAPYLSDEQLLKSCLIPSDNFHGSNKSYQSQIFQQCVAEQAHPPIGSDPASDIFVQFTLPPSKLNISDIQLSGGSKTGLFISHVANRASLRGLQVGDQILEACFLHRKLGYARSV